MLTRFPTRKSVLTSVARKDLSSHATTVRPSGAQDLSSNPTKGSCPERALFASQRKPQSFRRREASRVRDLSHRPTKAIPSAFIASRMLLRDDEHNRGDSLGAGFARRVVALALKSFIVSPDPQTKPGPLDVSCQRMLFECHSSGMVDCVCLRPPDLLRKMTGRPHHKH